MNKKILLILLGLLCISLVSATDLNYTSVSAIGGRERNGILTYFSDENPITRIVYEGQTTDISSFCVDSLTEFNTCTLDGSGDLISTDCLGYTINDSTTLVDTTLSNILTGRETTVYCQLCNATGYCDNSTYSGNNYVTFQKSALSTTAGLLMFLVLSVVAIYGIIFTYTVFDKNPKLTNKQIVWVINIMLMTVIAIIIMLEIIF